MLLNTSVGQKTPWEVLELIRRASLAHGALRGLFSELKQRAPDEARQAVQIILANRDRYDPKLIRSAEEMSTGQPKGLKRITNERSAHDVLRGITPGSRVRITFKNDPCRGLSQISDLQRIFGFDRSWLMMVFSCVVPSGHWEGIDRSQSVIVGQMGDADIEVCALIFAQIVESVEVLYTQAQFIAANDPTSQMLADNPELFYDAGLFREVCGDIKRFTEADGWIKQLNTASQMSDVLAVFNNPVTKIDFLTAYIDRFRDAMA